MTSICSPFRFHWTTSKASPFAPSNGCVLSHSPFVVALENTFPTPNGLAVDYQNIAFDSLANDYYYKPDGMLHLLESLAYP